MTEQEMLDVLKIQEPNKHYHFTAGNLFTKKRKTKGSYLLIPTRCPSCGKLQPLDFWREIPSIISLECLDCEVGMEIYKNGVWISVDSVRLIKELTFTEAQVQAYDTFIKETQCTDTKN